MSLGVEIVLKSRSQSGVTLIELVVAIAILAILAVLAAPSFSDFAERQALKGAANNIVGVIVLAKEEAAKRDKLVRVEFHALGSGVCVGAVLGTGSCDCSAGKCPLASSGESARDVKRVTLVGTPSFGSDAGFVIDPKTGGLLDFADTGSVQLETSRGYGVTVNVNAMARANVCVPSGKKDLPGVKPCS